MSISHNLNELEDVEKRVPLHERNLARRARPQQLLLGHSIILGDERGRVAPALVVRRCQIRRKLHSHVERFERLRKLPHRDVPVRPPALCPVLLLVLLRRHLHEENVLNSFIFLPNTCRIVI